MKKWLIAGSGLLFLAIFLYWQNNSIVMTDIEVTSEKLPKEFDRYKIVQLSDLHSKSFGERQQSLLSKVRKVSPDIIVFTGDLVDQKKYDEESSLALMKELLPIAPVFFITGNHEWWSGKFSVLEERLTDLGVVVLRNEHIQIEKADEKITIIGIDDPAGGMSTKENMIHSSAGQLDGFKILLAHRPEFFPLYQKFNIDLILSGHAHGGQFRLPFLGGIIAPDQGFFPEYDGGRYDNGDSVLIVNRGLGNSIIPQRLFNRPEIIVVTLSSE